MFINVSNQLPKTSYIKMMDVWLIFNLILPFTEVLLHTWKVRTMMFASAVTLIAKLSLNNRFLGRLAGRQVIN